MFIIFRCTGYLRENYRTLIFTMNREIRNYSTQAHNFRISFSSNKMENFLCARFSFYSL